MNKERAAPLEKTRVIGVFAHVDAGKTTTSEAMLYHSGRIHRLGRVDDGNTQLDWMEQERRRGITVTSAATTFHWRGHRVNLIDTPGHIDFSAEVVRSIRVIDGAVIVLCGVGGVEPQTETVWMHADQQALPRILFVNKLDRPGADFDRVLAAVRERLAPQAVPLQLPVGREGQFTGAVDLISRQALIWREGADDAAAEPLPPALAEPVEAARAALLDAVCETDDALLAQHLAGREPAAADLQATLRRATITGRLVPVTCGAALKRIGVPPLLDAVAAYLPSPSDVPAVRPGRPDEAFCASAFKIVADPHVGHLTWVRVFSGRLNVGGTVYNPRADVQERVTRIYRMHANRREQADHMAAGDVVALVGVKSAATGDTLCDPAHPIHLERSAFPEPVIMVALTPDREEQREKLHRAVARLCQEDPTLSAGFDPQTREQTLAGMGELHLEVAVDRLRSEFALTPQVSPPQVAYRETPRQPAEATGTYRKQTGGHGHFARVDLRVEPLPRGQGLVFENASTPPGGAPGRRRGRRPGVPAEFVRHVEQGVREAAAGGALAGYPTTDMRVTLLGGQFHEVDSSRVDFHIAASMAMRQAMLRGRPALLEPIMRFDVNAGKDHLGAVTADVQRRRGSVKAVNMRGDTCNVSGEVPLAEVRGYATDLRSLTAGRSSFTLELLRYEFVPDAVAEAVVTRRREDGKTPER